ncbi:MAG: OmpA family protein [Muribaculaceae bacterium]|nr:OmpA family protein [Muribaculaceae bacterium]
MKFNKILLAGAMLFAGASAMAQETITEYTYVPNWYIQGQFGGQETLGEISFSKLLSMNAQIAAGYNFNPYVGLRLAVNAWQSKGGIDFNGSYTPYENGVAGTPYAVGNQRWKWNYIAPTVDVTFNLTNLLWGYNPYRVVDVNLIGGVGANIAWNNKEANQVHANLSKLGNMFESRPDLGLGLNWEGTKARFLGQFGLDANFNVSQHVSLGIELMANVLPDSYNSKQAYNADWYFNGLVGVRYTFGPKYIKTTRTVEVPVQQPQVIERIIEKVIEPAPVTNVIEEVRPEMLRRDIFFRINTYNITKDEMYKVNEVAEFLKNHPNAKVVITGYADKGTGTLAINLRLSKQRAEVVANTLKSKYNIAADRIIVKSMGEAEEQPYADPVDNRVAICVCE